MKNLIMIVTMSLLTSAASVAPVRADDRDDTRAQVRAQAQTEIDKQRKQAEEQARQSLDQDALTAVQETRRARKAIGENKHAEARAALETAAGKIGILVARHPAAALIPVELQIEVIEAAPMDPKVIKELGKAAENAVDDKDFPRARVVLQGMVSELRTRTYNVPLGTYPAALREAARLLDQNKTQEAYGALQATLNSLVVIERVRPLPILVAQLSIGQAQASTDKAAAQRLLAVAKLELARAKELGYAGEDPEYDSLKDAISDVEKQINDDKDAGSAFARLKERIGAFFKRVSETEKRIESSKR